MEDRKFEVGDLVVADPEFARGQDPITRYFNRPGKDPFTVGRVEYSAGRYFIYLQEDHVHGRGWYATRFKLYSCAVPKAPIIEHRGSEAGACTDGKEPVPAKKVHDGVALFAAIGKMDRGDYEHPEMQENRGRK